MAEPARKLPEEGQSRPSWRPTVIQGGGEGGGEGERSRGHLQAVPNNKDVYDKPGSEVDDRHLHAVPNVKDGEEDPDQDQATQADGDEGRRLQPQDEGEDQDESEDEDDDLNNSDEDRRKYKMSVIKRRMLGATIVLGLIFGGGGGTFFVVKPVIELIHLGALFGNLDWRTDHSVRSRLRQFKMQNPIRCRLGTCDGIGETRVTWAGSRRFHRVRGELENSGITFDRGADDRPTAMNIDANRNTQFGSPATNEAKRGAIANFFGVDLDRVEVVSGTGVFRIPMQEMGVKSLRAITFSSLKTLGKGKIVSALNNRIFSRYFGIRNLFQPSRRIGDEFEQRDNIKAARAEAENERRRAHGESVNESLPDRYRSAVDSVKSNVSPNAAKQISRAMFVSDALCTIRDIATEIPLVNYASIVVPAVIAAVDKKAIGSAVQAGETSLNKAGSVVESFVDSDGRSIWASKALNALVYRDAGTGIDIDNDLKQSFTSFTTGNGILDWLRDNDITETACNDVVQIIVSIADIALTIVTIGSWKAAAAAGTSTAASMAATAMVQARVVDALSEDPITAFAGPQGGNLMAHGARFAANLNGIALGGIALTATETRAQQEEFEKQQQKEFQEKNLFARMFDIHEPRSLASSAVRSSNTSPARVLSNMASGFMNIGSIFSNVSGAILTPKLAAQAEEPYDWGFPIYGVPQEVLDNPTYENPYENAELTAELFEGDGGQRYIDKAKDCFGVEIVQLPVEGGVERWSVVPDEEINPTDDSYTEADCGNLEDPNWARVLVFVFDTSLITLIDCYEGDQASCDIIFYGLPEEEDPSGPVPTNPGDCPDAEAQVTEGAVADEIAGAITVVEGTEVHGCVAEQFGRMVAAARRDGVDITGGGGYRSLAEQIRLRMINCGFSAGDPRIYTAPSGACNPPTARPGYSQHERGLAVDFRNCSSHGTACWGWLNLHAGQFGYLPFSEEPWHWSTTGH